MATDANATDYDAAYVLSIGAIYGGPEFSPWRDAPWQDAIKELSNRVATVREGVESPLNLNVVFHVPGSILKPEFSGVRTGSFRKRDCHLMVQVALPVETPDDQARYLHDAVVQAVDAVEGWNSRKGRGYDLSAIRLVVAGL
ncbi:MAG: hypothetical protein FD171_2252 [Actinobacteria bacterium]|nr:MAG: hypothetical protein FD171_2252 [Actinomycetota bacterium]